MKNNGLIQEDDSTALIDTYHRDADRNIEILQCSSGVFRDRWIHWAHDLWRRDQSESSIDNAYLQEFFVGSMHNRDWFHSPQLLAKHDDVSTTSTVKDIARLLFRGRMLRLRQYLTKVTEAGLISQEISWQANRVWNRLSEMFSGSLAVPDASPGPNGELLFTWDKDDYHLDLEFAPEGKPTFFYMNRSSGESSEFEFDEFNVPRHRFSAFRQLPC